MKLKPLLGAAIPLPVLAEPEMQMLASLQSVLDEHLAPLALENDQRGRYPSESMQWLKSSGVMKAVVPKDQGGLGASERFSMEAITRITMTDTSVGQLYKIHDELVREIFVYCPDFQRQRLGAAIVDNNEALGLAVAEPGRTAVDPLKTTATPTEDGGFVVDGFKIYTSAAAEADHIATWAFNAAAATPENPIAGMQLLLIPKDTQGVKIHRDWNALGQRSTDSGSITFSSVRCSPEWVASVPGKAPLLHASIRYQLGLCAMLVGMGLGAMRAALPYIQEKSRPWAAAEVDAAVDDPLLREEVGYLVANLSVAYSATMACADLLDAFEHGDISRAELAIPISAAKVASNKAGLAATQSIHGLMGTGSVAGHQHFDYWWRNARTMSLHDPMRWKAHEVGRHVLTGWEPEPGVYQ